jgi:hypothetical protein
LSVAVYNRWKEQPGLLGRSERAGDAARLAVDRDGTVDVARYAIPCQAFPLSNFHRQERTE